MASFWTAYADAARTALGFFWKSGWAFVLGYAVSAMIQAFVPKARLTRRMGEATVGTVGLSTLVGAVSSSCSFAALAAARSLVVKGAHFVLAVTFMFASTNLVIELGILILLFLGWQFLVAELIGGLVLIAISTLLIRATYPHELLQDARERAEAGAPEEEDDFDWRQRIRSREGWQRVGHAFVMDWKMVWKEIVIGFTVAGFVAVLVPAQAWATLFLTGSDLPGWLVTVENALVAPFVAAATFIGSMGNIPLATVLNTHGVLFAGIMGFIYSDLMVPPLVAVNAKYYGWRAALYIAVIMYVSMVTTALILNGAFVLFDAVPESAHTVTEVVRFAIDYTFWFNLGFAAVTLVLVRLHRERVAAYGAMEHEMEGDGPVKRIATGIAIAVMVVGVAAWLLGIA